MFELNFSLTVKSQLIVRYHSVGLLFPPGWWQSNVEMSLIQIQDRNWAEELG